MEIQIKVTRRASRQQLLLKLISSDNCIQTEDKVTIIGIYEEDKRVEDSYRYVINISNGTSFIKPHLQNGKGKFNDLPATNADNNVIALIIESPHRDEYDSIFNPIAPAQGSTGDNIRNYLCHIFDNHISIIGLQNGDYQLIICNPVQFQASLFQLHRKPLSSKDSSVAAIRDKVLNSIYRYEKENFLNRLKAYNPILIINACTSKLKPLIKHDLIEWKMTKKVVILEAEKHPCVWSSAVKLTKN